MSQFIASVTQIETFDVAQPAGCELRWLFEYGVGGKRSPQGPGALEGEIGHAHLAKYLRTGEAPEGKVKLGKAVRAAIQNPELPKPKAHADEDFHVELRFDGQPKHSVESGRWLNIDLKETLWFAGVPWEGFIDLTFRRDDVPTVLDHKFTAEPRKTAKTRDELIKTIQLPIYVVSQMPYWPDAKRWDIAHHYVARKGVDSFIVRKTVTADQVLERAAGIEKIVKRVVSLREATDPKEFKPNRRACDAYGGCPHQSRCPAFNQRNQPMALSADEEAMFSSDLPPVDPEPAAPAAVVSPPPPPPAPEQPAAETKPVRRMPIVDVTAESTKCACGVVVNKENGSLLQTGVWKHIGCPLSEVKVTPPDVPASKPELATNAPPQADLLAPTPKPRKNAPKPPEAPPSGAIPGPNATATPAPPPPAAAALPAPNAEPGVVRLPKIYAPPIEPRTADAREALAQLFESIAVLVRHGA